MGCRPAYISRVFQGTADFSLEQAEKLSRALGHHFSEKNYFLLLLQKSRSGTAGLSEYFESLIQKVIDDRLMLKNRLPVKRVMTPEHEAIYYGSWHYAALHILASIPKFRSAELMSSRLGLPLEKTRAA